MDVQQVVTQATAVATAIVVTAVPPATPTPTPAPAPSLFPTEVGYIITALLGALATYVVSRLIYGIQRRDQFKLEAQREAREKATNEERIQRERVATEEQRYREWRHDIERKQEEIQRDFDQRLNGVNMALMRLERSIQEIDDYIEPIRDAARLSIRRKLQDDVPGS